MWETHPSCFHILNPQQGRCDKSNHNHYERSHCTSPELLQRSPHGLGPPCSPPVIRSPRHQLGAISTANVQMPVCVACKAMYPACHLPHQLLSSVLCLKLGHVEPPGNTVLCCLHIFVAALLFVCITFLLHLILNHIPQLLPVT